MSDSHLSFPAPAPPAPPAPVASTSTATPIRKDRLYVGNLHPTVDEYTLLQLFTKYGKISRLDFLFHKSGPAKGKPRGYAFVEFSAKEDANKALVALHDKLVRGRRLVVTYAHEVVHPPDPVPGSSGLSRLQHRRTDTTRPTSLSLIKTHNKPGSTNDKIAALEAKLKQMHESTPTAAGPAPRERESIPSPHDI